MGLEDSGFGGFMFCGLGSGDWVKAFGPNVFMDSYRMWVNMEEGL